MEQVYDTLPQGGQGPVYTCLYYLLNTMGADVIATQGARASEAMILT